MRPLREYASALRRSWTDARTRHPYLAPSVLFAFLLLAIVPLATVGITAAHVGDGLPDTTQLRRIGDMDQATGVYDSRDRLVFTIYKEQRIDVPLDQMSPRLIKAILSIEDQRFYEHQGFDLIRIGSAALANIRHGRAAQGGSTITQQLARQSFLTPDKTFHRKIQEVILASRIERMYSKPQILEMYLNKVYFGDGLYGVEAASRGYFGKHASELNVAEAAVLAGLVKSPSTYAPTVSKERALARRNVVLQAMLEAGAIDRPTWQAARAEKLVLRDNLRSEEPHGQYFKEQVRRELVDRFGWQRVYQGGLRVYSTIDIEMQQQAETAVAQGLRALDERRRALAARRQKPLPGDDGQPLQAALVAMDPATGHVRAMIGGRDFDESHFNRAVQAHRQPGSAFKPFLYATALEAGYTPASVIDNLDEPVATLQGAWTPEDEHLDSDSISLRTALRTSSNKAAVRLIELVGIAKTVQYAKNLGVGDVPSVPSLALGSGEVTLQSMTAAYAAFANDGQVPQPMLIRRVEERDGRVLYAAAESAHRAITSTTAFLMSTMMADVINAGTGSKARSLGFTLPAAGKTGTTNDFNDAWFVGYTPHLVAGVWVGFDQPHTILPNGFAGDVAVPMWASFMKSATKGDKPDWFAPPSGIVTANVCRLSGKLASAGCENVEVTDKDGHLVKRSMVYTEYFVRGTEPTTTCLLHSTHSFFGTIASVFKGDEKPAPVRIEDTGIPQQTAATSGVTPEAPPAPAAAEQPKKKRGFWSRVFGGGKNNDKAATPEQGAGDDKHQDR